MPSHRIKVLHVTNSLNYGGLERVVVDICRYLNKEEFVPMVACLKWQGPQAKMLNDVDVSVVTLGGEGKGRFFRYLKFWYLKKIIRDFGPDIVHTHNTGPLIDTMAARLISLSFPKVIHTDHSRIKWPDKFKYMLFERIASAFVHDVVAVSEETRNNLVSYEKIPASKIQIIDNGISIDKYGSHMNKSSTIKAELGIGVQQPVIGLCVVLRKLKGIPYLLEALPAIVKAVPNVVCVIGGGGPERESLEVMAANLGLNDNIRFIGPRDDVERILPVFDVYTLPSESEGLPLSLLEAMAAQRCIVATSVGGVPTALEEGNCGVLIPPKDSTALADAVIGLLRTPEERNRLAAEAYRCAVDKYSAVGMAKKYGALYQRSVGLNLQPVNGAL